MILLMFEVGRSTNCSADGVEMNTGAAFGTLTATLASSTSALIILPLGPVPLI